MTAVIFDLDGTLLMLDVDIEPVRAEIAALFGARGFRGELRPILQRIGDAAAAVAATDAERAELVARGRRIIDEAELAAAPSARARDGAAALLATLRSHHIGTAIVTDNGRACVGPALAAAGLGAPGDFDVVITRDDVDRPKPAPDGLVAAARALASEPGGLLFVGDSPRDIAAGREARALIGGPLRVVAVTGGRGDGGELAGAGADAVVDALDEIMELVA